jgi:hypothetical protein
MEKQRIHIEINKGIISFRMNNFGKSCEKEALFLERMGKDVSSHRDEKEWQKESVKIIEKT